MPDLDIYEDLGPDEQIETAHLRFVQALAPGRALEAACWRRLWRELCEVRNAMDAEIFAVRIPPAPAPAPGGADRAG